MPGATDSPGPPSPPGRRRLALLLAIAAGGYVADVVSKVSVVATLSHRPPLHVLDGVLTLVVLRNSGAAFRIGNSVNKVLRLIGEGAVVAMLRTTGPAHG